MTTLALGRRQLAAHPPYGPTGGLTCATVYRTHVHVKGGIEPHYFMPDACAACGRQWFAEGEHTYMGYCGDCWPGNAMLLDYSGDVEVGPATYPQPVRARGRAKPTYAFTLPACPWCGQPPGTHILDCPYGPVMQYVRRSGH